jgi:WD40 repeat protein
MGIISVALTPKGDSVVVGCGDGTISILSLPNLRILKSTKIDGCVTSINFLSDNEFVAGTAFSNIYQAKMDDMKPVLKSTCHYSKINDICYPQ